MGTIGGMGVRRGKEGEGVKTEGKGGYDWGTGGGGVGSKTGEGGKTGGKGGGKTE